MKCRCYSGEPVSCADCDREYFQVSAESFKALVEALKDALDTIHGEFCGEGHHPLCIKPREALAKLEQGRSG